MLTKYKKVDIMQWISVKDGLPKKDEFKLYDKKQKRIN